MLQHDLYRVEYVGEPTIAANVPNLICGRLTRANGDIGCGRQARTGENFYHVYYKKPTGTFTESAVICSQCLNIIESMKNE